MGNSRSPRACVEEMAKITLEEKDLTDSAVQASNDRLTRRVLRNSADKTNTTHEESKKKKSEETNPPKSAKTNSDIPKTKQTAVLAIVGLILLVFVVDQVGGIGLCASIGGVFRYSTNSKISNRLVRFDDNFPRVKNEFSNQFDFTWKALNRSLRPLAINEMKQTKPIVILMLGTGNRRDHVQCLSERVKTFVELVHDDKDCLGIKSEELVESNYDDATLKLKFDQTLIDTLNKSKCHVVVIEDIDRLKYSELGMLQSYCDEENAPYKNVAFVLTATTKERPPNENSQIVKESQYLARKHLDEAWKHIEIDYREALMSRFFQYILVMGEGSHPSSCAFV